MNGIISKSAYDQAVSEFDALSEYGELFFRHTSMHAEMTAIAKDGENFYVVCVSKIADDYTTYCLLRDEPVANDAVTPVEYYGFDTHEQLLIWQHEFIKAQSHHVYA